MDYLCSKFYENKNEEVKKKKKEKIDKKRVGIITATIVCAGVMSIIGFKTATVFNTSASVVSEDSNKENKNEKLNKLYSSYLSGDNNYLTYPEGISVSMTSSSNLTRSKILTLNSYREDSVNLDIVCFLLNDNEEVINQVETSVSINSKEKKDVTLSSDVENADDYIWKCFYYLSSAK